MATLPPPGRVNPSASGWTYGQYQPSPQMPIPTPAPVPVTYPYNWHATPQQQQQLPPQQQGYRNEHGFSSTAWRPPTLDNGSGMRDAGSGRRRTNTPAPNSNGWGNSGDDHGWGNGAGNGNGWGSGNDTNTGWGTGNDTNGGWGSTNNNDNANPNRWDSGSNAGNAWGNNNLNNGGGGGWGNTNNDNGGWESSNNDNNNGWDNSNSNNGGWGNHDSNNNNGWGNNDEGHRGNNTDNGRWGNTNDNDNDGWDDSANGNRDRVRHRGRDRGRSDLRERDRWEDNNRDYRRRDDYGWDNDDGDDDDDDEREYNDWYRDRGRGRSSGRRRDRRRERDYGRNHWEEDEGYDDDDDWDMVDDDYDDRNLRARHGRRAKSKPQRERAVSTPAAPAPSYPVPPPYAPFYSQQQPQFTPLTFPATPLHNVNPAYTQAYAYHQQQQQRQYAYRPTTWRADYILPSSTSSTSSISSNSSFLITLNLGLRRNSKKYSLHPLLQQPNLTPGLDLRLPPNPSIHPALMSSEPATSPPLTHMRLIHPRLPWFIDILPGGGGDSYSNAPYVRVADVIQGVYASLLTGPASQVKAEEYWAGEMGESPLIPPSSRMRKKDRAAKVKGRTPREDVSNAWRVRGQLAGVSLPDQDAEGRELARGVRRVDWLAIGSSTSGDDGGVFRWTGLRRVRGSGSGKGVGMWEVVTEV